MVDARPLYTSGIGRYLREVLSQLLQDARFSRITLLGDPAQLHGFLDTVGPGVDADVQAFPTAMYDPRAYVAWLRLMLTRRIRADVAFFPHFDTPLLGLPRRSVVTVHDLIHFRVPDAFPQWRRTAARVVLSRAVKRAAGILVGSEATRRDLLELFPTAAGKTQVISYGVGPEFKNGTDPEDMPAAEPSGLQPYLLCVGNRKRHKNLGAAVETLAMLRAEMPLLKLVIVGRLFPDWEATRQLAVERGVADALVELENVSDAQLGQLYSHCKALLFPSLYEGFGLPVLEAMACGAPVIASNRSSVPEVAGDAALLIDPEDPRTMAEAVLRLEREPGLRQELRLRGKHRASLFRWRSTGEIILDLLYRVGSARPL